MADPTEKQARFVEAYCGEAFGNGAEAARRAGYRAKDAHAYSVVADRLLASVGIRQAIEAFREKTRSEAMADAQEVGEFLTAAMRAPAGVEPSRLQAAALLAKIRGYSAPEKHEHDMRTAAVSFVFEDNGRGPKPE